MLIALNVDVMKLFEGRLVVTAPLGRSVVLSGNNDVVAASEKQALISSCTFTGITAPSSSTAGMNSSLITAAWLPVARVMVFPFRCRLSDVIVSTVSHGADSCVRMLNFTSFTSSRTGKCNSCRYTASPSLRSVTATLGASSKASGLHGIVDDCRSRSACCPELTSICDESMTVESSMPSVAVQTAACTVLIALNVDVMKLVVFPISEVCSVDLVCGNAVPPVLVSPLLVFVCGVTDSLFTVDITGLKHARIPTFTFTMANTPSWVTFGVINTSRTAAWPFLSKVKLVFSLCCPFIDFTPTIFFTAFLASRLNSSIFMTFVR